MFFFLPSTHEILSGEITDYSGRVSKQEDILIYRRDTPKLTMTEGPGLLFIEGAKATIEVKSNLTWENFRDALSNIMSVKSLTFTINPFAVGEKADYIFCYLFAYEGPSDETMVEYYNRFRNENKLAEEDFFKMIPDATYVLGMSLFYKNDGYVWKKTMREDASSQLYAKSDDPIALSKFFFHLAIAISYPDIYTIDWKAYLSQERL